MAPAQAAAAPQASVASPLEYQVKAAYILNFVNLTQWPPAALGPPSSPLRICLSGSDKFQGVLESTVRGESVMGHPLVVERLARDTAQACHVLFVPGGGSALRSELLRGFASAPVLTIGDGDTFLNDGGMVGFILDQGHVRFDISRTAAERHGLTLSSRMLRVARKSSRRSV